MKFLKTYDNYIPTEYELNLQKLKILIKHFTEIIEKLGFNYENYIDKQKYEVEFNHNFEYIFYLSMEIDIFKHDNIILKIKNSLKHNFSIVLFIIEYLKNINGIKFINYDNNFTYTYQIKIKDVDKIINQVTIEDIKYKLEGDKYNL